MTEHFLFYTGLSFLTIHEMDAIRCREWKILPGLSLLSDKLGQIIFVFAHIPLLLIVFYNLTNNTDLYTFVKGFDIFMVVHIGFHLLLLRHKNNEFKDWISWTLIVGAGIFGLADILIS
jgi:hypothetical protein